MTHARLLYGSVRRRWVLAAVLALAPGAAAARAAKPPAAGKARPGFEDGPLHSVANILKDIIQLTFEDGHLRLDREHWGKPIDEKAHKHLTRQQVVVQGGIAQIVAIHVNQLPGGSGLEARFQQLKAAAGARGSSSSRSGQGRQMSFQGVRLSAGLTVNDDFFRIRVQEEAAPWRMLQVHSERKGAMRIALLSADSGLVLMLTQDAAGAVKVLHLAGDETIRGRGESFLSYYRQNRRYVENDLFALLAHVGVATALGREKPRVAAAVLAGLRAARAEDPAERRRQAQRLIQQLDSGSYAQRQEATRKLSADYPRYFEYVEEALRGETASEEMKARLKRIAAENRDRAKVQRLITSLGLLDDPHYLVELLERTKAEDRDLVVAQLEKITKQKLGADAKAWRRHLQGHSRRSEKAPAPGDGS